MASSRPSTISSESDQIQVQTKPTVVSMLISVLIIVNKSAWRNCTSL